MNDPLNSKIGGNRTDMLNRSGDVVRHNGLDGIPSIISELLELAVWLAKLVLGPVQLFDRDRTTPTQLEHTDNHPLLIITVAITTATHKHQSDTDVVHLAFFGSDRGNVDGPFREVHPLFHQVCYPRRQHQYTRITTRLVLNILVMLVWLPSTRTASLNVKCTVQQLGSPDKAR